MMTMMLLLLLMMVLATAAAAAVAAAAAAAGWTNVRGSKSRCEWLSAPSKNHRWTNVRVNKRLYTLAYWGNNNPRWWYDDAGSTVWWTGSPASWWRQQASHCTTSPVPPSPHTSSAHSSSQRHSSTLSFTFNKKVCFQLQCASYMSFYLFSWKYCTINTKRILMTSLVNKISCNDFFDLNFAKLQK